ncbi:hypothetical protein ACG9XQ_05595 [Acinetobacter baumannii]|uniref:hypothetical protein n=1 Tax=Acinetobacter baumannii TaxID=470 RepID=UPI003AF846C0
MDKKTLLEQFKAEVEASGTSLTHILKMCEFDEVSNDFKSDKVHDYSIGCLNGAWWMFQRQQAKVEELQQENLRLAYGNTSYYNQAVKQNEIIEKLQKRVDSIREVLEELQEQADVIRKRGQKFRDSNFLASADMMDICIKEIEQALKGEGQ